MVIVNETMARRYWTGRNPIGGHIHFGQDTLEVVGVARDGKYGTITEAPRAFMYLPVQQWYRPDTILALKTQGDPASAASGVQRLVRELDPNLPVFEMRTIAAHLEFALFVQRMAASLLGVFGVLALFLATIGLYGVIAATVAQRTLGDRHADGARRKPRGHRLAGVEAGASRHDRWRRHRHRGRRGGNPPVREPAGRRQRHRWRQLRRHDAAARDRRPRGLLSAGAPGVSHRSAAGSANE